MVNNFEIQFDPKSCKYYIDAYDVIFVDDQRELRFGRYCNPMDANVSGKYHMVVKDNNLMTYNIDRNRALCFYDIDRHRWSSKVDDHRYKCWEVIRPDDDIFINVLVGVALDEIFGSKTCLSVDDITHRIKSRFGIWFDEYVSNRDSNKSLDGIDIRNDKLWEKRIYPTVKPTTPPQPKLLQFNGDYTTVVWKDGSHTVVKRSEGEEYDEEKAILFAIVKHLCKDNGCEMSRYFDKFFKNERNINKED